MKKGILLIACCIVLVFGLCSASYSADKVGYINLQRLVNESEMGKAARVDIQKMRQEKEAELKGKLQEFNSLRDLLNKNGNKMDPADKRDKIQDLNRTSKDYQRLLADAREDIASEDRGLVAFILEKADSVLKSVAKKNNYSIILKDPNAIGYLDPGVDITDEVLKELNK
ncbi:OmpH family outer membrane protein [Thermodesulfobacteriota bacterium]